MNAGPMNAAPTDPAQLLLYLPQHRVVICKECCYAIQPPAISRHLKDLHRIYRSNRQGFLKYAEGLDLADPKDVILPDPNEEPVPFLPTVNGLVCGANGCDHLCATVKRMKMHWSTEHRGVVVDELQWRPVDLQTFFRGNQLRYFIVRQSSTDSSQSQPHSNIVSETASSEISTSDTSLAADSAICCESDQAATEDLKLLEHFQSSTCLELGYDARSRQIWHTEVPILAAKHKFLRHGVLACAALHLAFLNPSERQRYQLIAAHHQSIALPGFRSEIVHANLDNCFALLAFTQLLVTHCFAADQQDKDLLLVQGRDDVDLPDWLHVIRGSCQIFASVWPYIQDVPFTAIAIGGAEHDEQVTPSPEKPFYDARLHGLIELIKSYATKNMNKSTEVPYTPLVSALLILTRAFAKAEAAQSRNAYTLLVAVHTWPVQVPQDYLDLLKDRNPVALILLAHYCILLRPLEGHWYMSGYSRRLLTRIYTQVDETYRPWLQWPLEEIGLQCPSH